MTKNCFKYFSSFTLILLFVFSADFASAHRVVIFAWTEGDMVFTQSQFPDGRKIADAQVNVFDPDDRLLLEGKTDANGEFSFKIPKITALNIVLEAGMGHQGNWKLSEEEIRSSMGIGMQASDSKKTEALSSPAATIAETSMPADNPKAPGSPVLLDKKQLEQIIEKALDKKIHPLTQMLAQMQDKGPSVNDIFGGIGYILGLMGIAAYFLSREKV